MKFLVLATAIALSLITGCTHEENNISVGPGFEKNQLSSKKIQYSIPTGWKKDEKARSEVGLYAVLVPKGKSIENASMAITIAFQKKSNQPNLQNLKAFFTADMSHMLAEFPSAKFERWQPAHLNPDQYNFFSIEMREYEKGKDSCQRVLYLDSGDGYYSVTLTTSTQKQLSLDIFDSFWNSIKI